ncbi:MAG: DUF2059 domain-containing protein [Rhizobacter sp.]|nr:DUF2059 domain-containing protein [Burkholderiaceae bacterium]MCO5125724.1 DUF2059 domain-containing protein [Rhizobacter sp.]
MKRLIIAALCAAATLAHAQTTKKELVQKALALQQPIIESISRSVAERPAIQLMQVSGQYLQTQVPPEKREAIGKQVETEIRKYVDEAVPLLRERALKLAPSTFGATMEEKFTEDELKTLIAWLESPVNKKFQQMWPEMQNGFVQKLAAEAAPLLDPKLQALQQRLRTTMGIPDSNAAASAPARPAASAAKPRK